MHYAKLMGILSALVLLQSVYGLNHPFTLFSQEEIPGLRTKMTDGLGNDDLAYDHLLNRADYLKSASGSTVASDYANFFTLGTAYHFESDNPDRIEYANACKDGVMYLVQTKSPCEHWFECGFDNSKPTFKIVFGYDLCYDAFSQEERELVIGKLDKFAFEMSEERATRGRPYYDNIGAYLGSSLLIASIILIEEGDPSKTALYEGYFDKADTVLDGVIETTIGSDGGYPEGILYSAVASEAIMLADVSRKHYDGGRYIDHPNVRNLMYFLAFTLMPEGEYKSSNFVDSEYISYMYRDFASNYPLYAQTVYGDGLSKWVSLQLNGENRHENPAIDALFIQDISEIDPESLGNSMLFRDSGYYLYRNGWELSPNSRDVHFQFFSGEFDSGHASEDKNSFHIMGYKDRLIVDSGDSSLGGHCNDRSTTTQGHNLIVIDGIEQYPTAALCGTDGLIRGFLGSDFVDFIHGDATDAYNELSPVSVEGQGLWCNTPEWCGGITKVERANRYFFVVKEDETPPYFIMTDDTKSMEMGEHEYTLFLHTELDAPNYENDWDYSGNPVQVIGEQGGMLDVLFVHPSYQDIQLSKEVYETWGKINNPDGSNADGPNMRLSAKFDSDDPYFFLIFYPYDDQVPVPAYVIEDMTSGDGVRLDFGSVSDHIFYSKQGEISGSSYDVVSDAELVLVREQDDLVKQFSVMYGTSLVFEGIELLSITEVPGISQPLVTMDGESLRVSDAGLSYSVFAPDMESAFADEQPLPVYKAGDYRLVTKDILQGCEAQGGMPCSQGTCDGEWIFSADSDDCCLGSCIQSLCRSYDDNNNEVIENSELQAVIADWLSHILDFVDLFLMMGFWKLGICP